MNAARFFLYPDTANSMLATKQRCLRFVEAPSEDHVFRLSLQPRRQYFWFNTQSLTDRGGNFSELARFGNHRSVGHQTPFANRNSQRDAVSIHKIAAFRGETRLANTLILDLLVDRDRVTKLQRRHTKHQRPEQQKPHECHRPQATGIGLCPRSRELSTRRTTGPARQSLKTTGLQLLS